MPSAQEVLMETKLPLLLVRPCAKDDQKLLSLVLSLVFPNP